MSQLKFAILGGGSWATAIIKILSENLSEIHWYIRDENDIEYIKKYKHNPKYSTSVELHTHKLLISSNINWVIENSDYLIFAIPSIYLNTEMEKVSVSLKNKVIFSAIKGIIPESGKIVGEHFMETYSVSSENMGVITGPCHAEEVALERLSYLTLACSDMQKAQNLAQVMNSSFIKTKISCDIIGVEYGAMLKNIYAIAAGIAHGLGYGDNFQSVLMSNAIREMNRYIQTIYNTPRDITESAYLGDLLVTGYSTFSRNRFLGNMLGKGYTVKSAFMEMNMVAEGYYATKSAYNINQKQEKPAKTPILNAVYTILYGQPSVNVGKIFKQLTENLD